MGEVELWLNTEVDDVGDGVPPVEGLVDTETGPFNKAVPLIDFAAPEEVELADEELLGIELLVELVFPSELDVELDGDKLPFEMERLLDNKLGLLRLGRPPAGEM